MRLSLDRLQPLGRALMLPIAVLPVAGILLRLGQDDLLGIAFVADAGGALFASLGLLFAIGVAVGLARENHGAAGLAGAVAYLVTVEGAKSLLAIPPDIAAGQADAIADTLVAAWKAKELAKLGVPAGIAAGLVSGALYNQYSTIKLPEYLAFFGGRRFVPIAAGLAGLIGALLFGLGFPILEGAIDTMSRWVVGAGGVGLFIYGALNRLLIVTGLHHILNNVAWFLIGDFDGVTGDLNRFFAGDPTAGSFMAGFFPVMMFGLPAACLAMYRSAEPERRRAVGGLFLSLGLTSFLTGVTEPIEFTFMFLAPILYAVHACLTGVSMVVMDALGVKLGFGFSAGLFDYLLNYGLATRPLLLLPVGTAYFAIYYASFRFCIARFNLATPGRERVTVADPDQTVGIPLPATTDRAQGYLAALGGRGNLARIDACTTRLRLTIADDALVDEVELRRLGARGTIRPGAGLLQVVIGPSADLLASEMRAVNDAQEPPGQVDKRLLALGGAENVHSLSYQAGRWVARVADTGRLESALLDQCAGHGWAMVAPGLIHILNDDASAIYDLDEQQPDII